MKTKTGTIAKWALDPAHSELQFKAKHLMISTVTGHFKNFSVTAEADEQFTDAGSINLVADIASLTTSNEQRDTHLRSEDFFDAEKYPQLFFKGSKWDVGNGEGKLHGTLSIKGISKHITLNVEVGGVAKDPWGQVKAGFTIHAKINRKDFGLAWNALTEAGGLVVSDEIKIHAEIQLIKQS